MYSGKMEEPKETESSTFVVSIQMYKKACSLGTLQDAVI